MVLAGGRFDARNGPKLALWCLNGGEIDQGHQEQCQSPLGPTPTASNAPPMTNGVNGRQMTHLGGQSPFQAQDSDILVVRSTQVVD